MIPGSQSGGKGRSRSNITMPWHVPCVADATGAGKAPDADATNGYATHAAFYARVAQSHPSVVFYSMSHNATGYA